LKQEVVKNSEAEKTKRINEAEGQGAAILTVATATAEGLRSVAAALAAQGGADAARLRVAEEYVRQIGDFAINANTIIVPSSVSDPASMIASAFGVFDQMRSGEGAAPAPIQPPPRR